MKSLKSDNALKIFSLLIAIILWIYVVQVESPDIEKTFKDVPVVFSQGTALEEKGLILLNDKDLTIDIKLKGTRKQIMDVSAENLTVLADVSSIDKEGTHTVFTSVVLPYGNLEVISKNPSALIVEVDRNVTQSFDITVKTNGNPKGDFVLGEVETKPSKINITGPKTILAGIESAVAEIEIDGANSDVTTVVAPKAYGTNGKEIDTSYIKFDNEEIQVRCEILKTKTVSVLPVLSSSFESAEESYTPDKTSLSTIKVKGAASAIDALSVVKTKPIELSDIDSSGNATVELELPDGVYSADGESFVIRFVKNEKR